MIQLKHPFLFSSHVRIPVSPYEEDTIGLVPPTHALPSVAKRGGERETGMIYLSLLHPTEGGE